MAIDIKELEEYLKVMRKYGATKFQFGDLLIETSGFMEEKKPILEKEFPLSEGPVSSEDEVDAWLLGGMGIDKDKN